MLIGDIGDIIDVSEFKLSSYVFFFDLDRLLVYGSSSSEADLIKVVEWLSLSFLKFFIKCG